MADSFELQEWARGYSVDSPTANTYSITATGTQKPPRTKQLSESELINIVNDMVVKGTECCNLNQFTTAKQYYLDAVKILRDVGWAFMDSPNAVLSADVLSLLGNVLVSLHEWQEAKQCFLESVELLSAWEADSMGLPFTGLFAEALLNLGNVHNILLEWEDAERRCLSAKKLYRTLGASSVDSPLTESYAATLLNLGIAQNGLLKWEEAKKRCLEAVVLYRSLGADSFRSPLANKLAATFFHLGCSNEGLYRWSEAASCYLEAIKLYRALGTHFNSSWAKYFIRTLTRLGRAYNGMHKWEEAKELCSEAVELYRSLGANTLGSSLASGLADTLFCLGVSNDSLHRVPDANQCYLDAVNLYRALGANSKGPQITADYAGALMNLSNTFCLLLEWKKAETYCTEAINLFQTLGLNSTSSPRAADYVGTLIILGNCYAGLKNFDKAKKYHEEAIGFLSNITNFTPNFVQLLNSLSRNHNHLPIDTNYFAKVLVKLALRWFALQPYDSKSLNNFWKISLDDKVSEAILLQQLEAVHYEASNSLTGFWQYWLEYALDNNDGVFLLDILGVLHARRLQTLLNLNIKLSGVLDDEQRQLVQLEIRQEQTALQKSTAELVLKNAKDEEEKHRCTQRLGQLSEQAQEIWDERMRLRNKLVEQGRYFDSGTIEERSQQLHSRGLLFDTDAIQAQSQELRNQLASDQAVVISVNLSDYGLEEWPPRLLLISRESISWLDMPEISRAAETLPGITRAMNERQYRLPLRSSAVVNAEQPIDGNTETDLTTLQQTMTATMSTCWQQLSDRLPNYKHISFIGHGTLGGLPWQGYAPDGVEVSYYSGLYAFHQRKENHSIRTALTPTEKSPITLFAYAADNNPKNRLYYLPAEIAAIEQIWSKDCIVQLNGLSEAKPENSLLLLLGHGDYHDGQARFMLEKQTLEQHDLMNYPHTLRLLGASACLLGTEQYIGGEPLGLLSLCGCRHDMAFSYGSLIPVDDLSTVCLSILFHCHWKQCSDPQVAIKLALSQLRSGQWDEGAKAVFKKVFTAHLPMMFRAMKDTETTNESSCDFGDIEERHENIIDDWGIGNGGKPIFGRYYRQFIDCDEDETAKQNAAQQLVEAFLIKATTDQYWLNKLASFTSFWIYG